MTPLAEAWKHVEIDGVELSYLYKAPYWSVEWRVNGRRNNLLLNTPAWDAHLEQIVRKCCEEMREKNDKL